LQYLWFLLTEPTKHCALTRKTFLIYFYTMKYRAFEQASPKEQNSTISMNEFIWFARNDNHSHEHNAQSITPLSMSIVNCVLVKIPPNLNKLLFEFIDIVNVYLVNRPGSCSRSRKSWAVKCLSRVEIKSITLKAVQYRQDIITRISLLLCICLTLSDVEERSVADPCPWFWIFIYRNGHVKILWLIHWLIDCEWR